MSGDIAMQSSNLEIFFLRNVVVIFYFMGNSGFWKGQGMNVATALAFLSFAGHAC